jgi:membrane-associated phospholipid phosphatase
MTYRRRPRSLRAAFKTESALETGTRIKKPLKPARSEPETDFALLKEMHTLAASVPTVPETETEIEIDPRIKLTRRLLIGAAIFAGLLVIGYLVLIGTSYGHRLDNAAFTGRLSLSRGLANAFRNLLEIVNKKGLLIASVLLLGIAAYRRVIEVGIIAVIAFGSSIVGAELLKHELPRNALVPGDSWINKALWDNSYPSGHTTVAASLVLAFLLVSPARFRPFLVVGGGLLSAAFATGVLAAGWHRPSDALGALAWSGFCMSVAAAVSIRFRGRLLSEPSRYNLGSVGLFVAVATTFLLALVSARAINYVGMDWVFFVLTGTIAAFSFALIGWYGLTLSGVEFNRND